MCRLKTVDYDPDPEAVPRARRWLRARLAGWELDPLAADAAVLITEVMTNGVVHAQSRLHVTAAVADGILEVGVSDHAATLPRPASPAATQSDTKLSSVGLLAEGGRGMLMIDSLADDWGVSELNGGKQVWFSLTINGAWPYRTACPCHGTDLDRVRLQSGRFAVAVAGAWDTED